MTKSFDLNIGKILENWKVEHALRELIANALDEKKLSNTKEIEIFKDANSNWHIRDFGRGIKVENFMQNENSEKLEAKNLIGRFGVGLKDCLATLQRNDASISIESKHLFISKIIKKPKHNFEDILTLSVEVEEPNDLNFEGTEIIISNVSDQDIQEAKNMFLIFKNALLLEETKFGQVLSKENKDESCIYLNGMKISQGENFLFHYNITAPDKTMTKNLNRERMSVGKASYSGIIKKILLNSQSESVFIKLSTDFKKGADMSDEANWIDVQAHIYKQLSKNEKYIFATTNELISNAHNIEDIRSEGKVIITISEGLRGAIGDRPGTLNDYFIKEEQSFKFDFVQVSKLTKEEKRVFGMTEEILKLFGSSYIRVNDVKISETMKRDLFNGGETLGVCWEDKIIIKRTQLSSLSKYAGTLMHELVHAKYDVSDSTRSFENKLTDLIGKLSNIVLKEKK